MGGEMSVNAVALSEANTLAAGQGQETSRFLFDVACTGTCGHASHPGRLEKDTPLQELPGLA